MEVISAREITSVRNTKQATPRPEIERRPPPAWPWLPWSEDDEDQDQDRTPSRPGCICSRCGRSGRADELCEPVLIQ
jgi:hypothetical protein